MYQIDLYQKDFVLKQPVLNVTIQLPSVKSYTHV